MVINPISSRIPVLLFASSIYLSLVIQHSGSVSFDFNFSDQETVSNNMSIQGDASFNNVDSIGLTNTLAGFTNRFSVGRAVYNQPVLLWDSSSGEVTDFTTRFSFLIQNTTVHFGAGFAFFLSPYPSQIPPNSNNYGYHLGLFNSTTGLNASANKIVAVEFDTFFNPGIDPNSTKQTDCHIGIDVNTIYSTNYSIVPNSFLVGMKMTAQIEYKSRFNLLSLLLWSDTDKETKFTVKAFVDIKTLLPCMCAVGFSAATGTAAELHQIYSWSFKSTLEVNHSLAVNDKGGINAPVVGGIIGGVVIMLAIVGILLYFFAKKFSINKIEEVGMAGDESINYEFEKGRGPKRFPYCELVDATNGFAENNKLGEGGFGAVYRGILTKENIHVAVKRVSKESNQGKKEYISEVKIISQLRHRNLVQLIGWCHDNGEFLLVYELMHNGSLDKHLYSEENVLDWPTRHNIALELGSALLYLHEEWEKCVLHRDVKPSNIMLDSSFNAKLGDFGLARLIDHNQELETTNIGAGTKGYIAPECLLGTENASTQSDVFSFGVVLLEITCGRRPIVPQQDQRKVSLVKWVWDLYGQKTHLEAVDERLNGDFDKEEAEGLMVVGLWCAHPEKSLRPSIRQAMSVLQFQAPSPILPPKMPVMPGYAAPGDFNMQYYTSSVAS
ncbi:hypothetical protein LUZ63_009307 [Rhynchospora breviuscula]|uniref:non-specific serine/threonine protein kinase n=1 Tax=Rhynchospora breviuscula TaxID=2022672 RepID=A0A9Q0HNI5_9POAL|nr:hypothetical protein LUZ63_009307 [Rhynchospora breviuscula]